jgi:hypothetical protein
MDLNCQEREGGALDVQSVPNERERAGRKVNINDDIMYGRNTTLGRRC